MTQRVLRALIEHPDESWPRWSSRQWQTLGAEPERAGRLVVEIENIDRVALEKTWEHVGGQIVTMLDRDYPRLLKEIHSPPPLLYVRGDVCVLQQTALAVVGTRRPTSYGLEVTTLLVGPVARPGLTIVSGLALGIDAAAHRVALENGAPTVAVLGCGIDRVYPWQHAELAGEIIRAGGAVISEFPLGAEPERHHFPQRNRIISGLSKAVLLIEAGEKSGALITAKFAVEQNREVLVVPGNITSPQSIGPLNWLKLGATPVTSADDILRVFALSQGTLPTPKSVVTPDDPIQAKIIDSLRSGPRHIDLLAEACRLDTSAVSAALSFLELHDLVRHEGGMVYRLNA